MKRVLVVNGPNLDRLGTRQPEIYGTATLDDLEQMVRDSGKRLGLEVSTFQSNREGDLIEAVLQTEADGIVINPGGLTHSSHALADAVASRQIPTVEVHISNIRERESWRAHSVFSEVCVYTIYGRGLPGYRAALRHLANRTSSPFQTVRYGPHPENVGDLRGGGTGLVILLHGGMWRHQFTRDAIESLAVDLTNRGYNTWNLEHRRIGAGGGWPAPGHDLLTAIDFIPRLEIEADPLVVMGHSAGGYLALWAAGRRGLSRVVGLAPVVDLSIETDTQGSPLPETALFRTAGAPGLADPASTPTLLVHSETDEVIPFAHSARLDGRDNVSVVRSDGGHFDLLDPSKPHWSTVLEHI